MQLSRKIKQQSNLTVAVIIVLAILVVVNILGGMVFHRFDLTENKTYSLSKTTKQSLKSLDDLVTIKAYISKELPNRLLVLRQEVVDFLNEYQNAAGGKIKVQFIDPKDDPKAEQEAMMQGIPPLQFSVQEEDKFQVSSGYIGLAVVYADKSESIPVISSLENLEYDLTTAIYKVSQEEAAMVGFLTGHGETAKESEMVEKELEKLYSLVDVDISAGNLIDPDIQTLVIAGPKEELSERDLYAIDQFLMSGKSVLFLVDEVAIGENLSATANNSGLEKLLAHYGVKVNADLVLDASNEIASFRTEQGGFYTNYPFWVKSRREFFDLENPIVNKLEAVSLPWVSSLELLKDKIGENKVSELIKSTPKSLRQSGSFNLDPQQPFDVKQEELKQSTLAAAVSGKFTSYFADKEPPAVEGGKESISATENVLTETENGRLIVVGNARFITDQFIQQFPHNLIFLQNAVDYLTLDESLMSIRAKQPTNRPLAEVSKEKKMAIRYFNVFGVTAGVILAGLLRFVWRKRKVFA